jgi:hypothetical protein
MIQNSALYALQHGATSDAFEIRARSKSLPTHDYKENENNK